MKAEIINTDDLKLFTTKAFVIDPYEAERYKRTILSVQKRMIRQFEKTTDGSLRKWINTHGPVLDDLLEELGHRHRNAR